MDKYKKKFTKEATKLDFYDDMVLQNKRIRAKDKKKLHKIARSRLNQEIRKELEEAGMEHLI